MNSWLIGKDPDGGKDWKQKKKRVDRRWDGWMASLIQWTWTWANSGRWWGTGTPDRLQSMGWQRVGHDLATEQHQQFAFLISSKVVILGEANVFISSFCVFVLYCLFVLLVCFPTDTSVFFYWFWKVFITHTHFCCMAATFLPDKFVIF